MRTISLLCLSIPLAAMAPAGCAGRAHDGRIHASGHIEATEVHLAAKVGGRLVEAPLEEGDRVRAGDLVARLEAVTDPYAPDLVVLDLMLPEMDGLDVCRKLRKESNVPIIMPVSVATSEAATMLTQMSLGASSMAR